LPAALSNAPTFSAPVAVAELRCRAVAVRCAAGRRLPPSTALLRLTVWVALLAVAAEHIAQQVETE
jgi:hypothetical protein